MKGSEERRYYHDMVAGVRGKLASLPEGSHIKSALPGDRLDQITEKIEGCRLEDLKYAYWPPLFLFVYDRPISEILAFEGDIDLVVGHSRRKQASEVTQFLNASQQDDRLWAGGLFEIFVKSSSLKRPGLAVELDYALPNGREADVRLEIGRKTCHVECTVISESDEDREVWGRFMAAKKADPNAVLVRPGKFDVPNSKSSPYYDTLRFYAKVYDKIAKDLDPKKGQMSEGDSNVLLISFYSPRAPLSPTSPGVGWALDELLADQPKSGARLKDYPPGLTDISLLAWLDFTAQDLSSKSRVDLKRYCDEFDEIVAAPRKIGAILLFQACLLRVSRVNYNAKEPCRISHLEIGEVEKFFEAPPGWCHR